MGRWKILLGALLFFLALGFLNRWPYMRRHTLVRRLNFTVDFIFWVLLIIYLGFFLYLLFSRI